MSSTKPRTDFAFRILLHLLILIAAIQFSYADVDQWKAAFKLAESVINTKSERDAIPIFRKVIGEISAERARRELTPEESALLEKGLDHLAQAFYNSNEMDKANETFLQLIDVNPNYRLNEDLVSPKIVQMFSNLKQRTLGTLAVVTNPKDAVVELDGRIIQKTAEPIYVKQGEHALKVSKPGFEPSKQTVEVAAGGRKDVTVELKSFTDAVAALLADRPDTLEVYQNAMASGDKVKIAGALKQAGDAVFEQRNIPEARRIYEQALTAAKEAGDSALAANITMALGLVLQAQNDTAGAQARFAEALASFQQTNNRDGTINAALRLGDLLQAKNDSAGAIKNYQIALSSLREKGDKANIAATLYKVGNIKRSQKDTTANVEYQEALSLFKELNDTDSASKVEMSLQDLRTDQKYRTITMLNQATALLNQGSYAEAERKFNEALDLARQIDAKDNAASALLNIGYIISGQGRHADARPKYQEALELSRQTGNKANQALALYDLAVTAFNLQDTVQANNLYDQSSALYKEMGESPRPKPW